MTSSESRARPRRTPPPEDAPAPGAPLNPLRYHAMINRQRIPEAPIPRRRHRRWPAVAGLGLTAILLAVAVASLPGLVALLNLS